MTSKQFKRILSFLLIVSMGGILISSILTVVFGTLLSRWIDSSTSSFFIGGMCSILVSIYILYNMFSTTYMMCIEETHMNGDDVDNIETGYDINEISDFNNMEVHFKLNDIERELDKMERHNKK